MKRIIVALCLILGFSGSSTLLPMWHNRQPQRECPVCLDGKPEHDFRWLGCGHNANQCRECLSGFLARRLQEGVLQDIRCTQCRTPLTEGEVNWVFQYDQNLMNRFHELRNAEQDRLAALRAQGITWEKRKMIWSGSRMDACPNCHEIIQKNGGCNHMTCRPPVGCGYEFCWTCMGPRGSYYGHSCNPLSILTTRLKRHHPAKIVITVAIVAAASYGAYKLHKYLNPPEPIETKDLKTHLNDLHKEAIKARARLAGADGYVAGMFKDYFAAQEAASAYKDLTNAQLTALKKIVDEFDRACTTSAGCDKQYAQLVKYMAALEKQEPQVQTTVPTAKKPVIAPKPSKPVVHKNRVKNNGRLQVRNSKEQK